MDDYIARYGLEFNPFLKNSRDIIIESNEFQEAQFRLNYLVETKGFGLCTGAPGLGKTTAVRRFAVSLNPSRYKVIYIGLSTVTVNDFYRLLASSLGQDPSYRKPDNFKLIQAAITTLAIEKRITPVIILDEANHINSAVLNDLKILFNFEMDSKDRAVILLVGQPQLNNTLNLNAHEALRQRIVMNYSFDGLSKEEGRIYIEQKLKGAGCAGKVFDENAVEAILNSAAGTPRIINHLCNEALLIANGAKHPLVTAEDAMMAINDSQL